MADGSSAKSSGHGRGTVTSVDSAGKIVDIELEKVLFVPQLDGSLLSVSKIADQGYTVTFARHSVEIRNSSGCVVVLGERHGDLYYLTEAERVSIAADHKHTVNCQHTWHRRLGHRDPSVFHRVDKERLTTGIKLTDCGAKFVCEICLEGKMARLPYPQQSQKKTTQPLELIHTDLCGPMKNITPGGNKYFLTLIDDYSRYVVLYLLSSKDEAKGCIKNFVRLVENQFGRKPQIIRSDRGGEFVNKDLRRFYRDEGIEMQLTAGYAPQQNGVAERRNRYLQEMAVCMLLDAGLDKQYWGEAIATAAYLQNRLPSRSVSKTPFELWKGKKPDFSHLRIFGCEAFVHIPDSKRGKLDSKAEKLIFVGYECGSKAYRFLNKNTNRITISRDAKFIELGSHLQEEKSTTTLECEEEQNEVELQLSFSDDDSQNEPEEPCAVFSDGDDSNLQYFDIDELNRNENEEPEQRRVQRQGAGTLPRRLNDYIVGVAKANEREPLSYQEAIQSGDKANWMRAMNDEYKSLMASRTWSLVQLPPGCKAIGSKWVLKQKKDTSGNVVRYKARLVAQGYAQKYGTDFGEVYAPVAMQTTLRVLLTVAGQRRLHVRHIDVKNAYLNGTLEEEIFMRQPPGYAVAGKEEFVCRLNKSLYGLKQAARVWNETVKTLLRKLGFQQSESDACLFMMKLNSEWIYLLIYVDDMLVVCKDEQWVASFEEKLRNEFEILSLGEVHQFLGVKVTKDTNGIYSLSQKAFIREIAERFGLEGAKKSNIPLDTGYYNGKDSEPMQSNDQFRSLIGALLYVTTMTRPDIAAAVSILSRQSSSPTQRDWVELKRVVRYLLGTEDYELCLGVAGANKLTLVGFSDADWASDTTDRKSTSGFLFKLGNATVSWASRKQSCVSTSTMEAEYVALSEAAQEVVWLRRLLSELGETQKKATLVYEDNRSCLDFVSLDRQTKRSKHIDTKFYHAKDLCTKGVIELQYCSTDKMVADILTKPLGPTKMLQHSEAMGLKRN